MKYAVRFLAIACLGTGLGGCRAKSHSPFTEAPSASATALKYPRLNVQPPAIKPEQFAIPVGPKLMALPGRGLGPVRFGASLATIERLIGATCTTKTENLCRYAPHAMEFLLEAGKLAEIHIHGDERPFPGGGGTPDNTYGIFNGMLPPKVELGMYPHVVEELIGPPLQSEQLDPPQGSTVLRVTYANNTVLEYDKLANGNTVLAGILLKPDPEAIAAARAAALAPAAASASASATAKPAASSKKKNKKPAKRPAVLH